MARYKYGQFLSQSDSNVYDHEHKPGEKVPNSGIYQCTGCSDEVACNKGDPLPPQNHHQHTNSTPIRWRLLVFAQQKK